MDYRAPRRLGLTLCNRSITDGLSWINGVAREYAGLVHYLASRTGTLFPAP